MSAALETDPAPTERYSRLLLPSAYEAGSAELEEILSGIAHEVRNSLHVLAWSLGELRRARPGHDEAREKATSKIENAAQEVEVLTAETLELVRPMKLERGRFSLDEIAESVRRGVSASANPAGVLVAIDCVGGPVQGLLDAPRVRDAIVRIVLNAIEASPRDGTVAVVARFRDGSLLVTIEDQGTGVCRGLRARRRMALACHAVEAHGGTLELATLEAGHRVIMSLPLGARSDSLSA
ncbi:HAMP domain-containing histidine kinase [bacterium]|nr:HAMP domain-containing histidine kinase [bacterium]